MAVLPSNYKAARKGFPPHIFIQKIDNKYLCSHCRHVLREPMQSFCGHRYCKRCVENFQSSTHCPICAEEDIEDEASVLSMETMFPDNAIKRSLNRLDVKCPTKHCDWKGKYKDYVEHEVKCEYMLVACPQGCGESVMVRDRDYHMAALCSMRMDSCKECGANVAAAELKSHLEVCPKLKMKCSGCRRDIQRDQIKSDNVQSHNKKCVVQESGAFTEGGASASATIACAPAESKVVSRRIEEMTETVPQLQSRVENMAVPSKGASSKGLLSALSALSGSDPNYHVLVTKISSLDAIMPAMHQELDLVYRVVVAHEEQQLKERHDLAKMQSTIAKMERELALKDITLAELNRRLQALDLISYDGVLVWKITDFSKKRAEAVAGPFSVSSGAHVVHAGDGAFDSRRPCAKVQKYTSEGTCWYPVTSSANFTETKKAAACELHYQLLQTVEENLIDATFEQLRADCGRWIEPAKLEKITKTRQLLVQLETQAVIEVGNYSELIRLLGLRRLNLLAVKVEKLANEIGRLLGDA